MGAPGRSGDPLPSGSVLSKHQGDNTSSAEEDSFGAHSDSHNLSLDLRIGMSQEENQGRKVRVLADFLSSLISKGFSQSNKIARGLVTSTGNNFYFPVKIRDF